MSATDELRRMLDERGVKYDARDGNAIKNTYWDYNGRRWGYTENANNSDIVTPKLSLISKQLPFPPEQAIAATLGGGECEDVGTAAIFKCSICGWQSNVFTFGEGMPCFCPRCGKTVKR